ncbi:MAG: outer membrane beta-barrel protein [Bacteroidales bacterium]|nr:outer membrane beta-barrel protein [Bacteroidales bacterium]
MNRRLFAVITGLLLAVCAQAQVVVMDYDMFMNNRNIKVKLSVQDAKTEEPLPFATVYLNPQGDTTITHFALSDQQGDVEIKDVPVGRYRLNVEMIGYTPFRKDCNFRNYEEDLGKIKLEENPEIIDAASITAVGNAIEVRQDTLIYNAAAFHVGDNAMLEDLIKKMPGMEVGEDGTVKVNGEPVDKITVGGKTFFFNDPTAALKNLPAKIVDKIKVIDQENKEAAFSGVASQDSREKVMDLQLKEEYKQGWFGNAKLGGGWRPGSDKEGLGDDRHALFNGNILLSGYNEQDQLTLLANGQNAPEPGNNNAIFVAMSDDIDFDSLDAMSLIGGLKTSAMAGANLNSDRIKGVETTGSVSYNFSDQVSGQRSARQSTLVGESPLFTDGRTTGNTRTNRVNFGFELNKKDPKRFNFTFQPKFGFNNSMSSSRNQSTTTDAQGVGINGTDANKSASSRSFQASGRASVGYKDFGKERRSLNLIFNYNFSKSLGESREDSRTWYGTTVTPRDLRYDTGGNGKMLYGSLTYLEPFGQYWGLAAIVSSRWQQRNNDKAAFNADGSANDYYSTMSRNDYLLLHQSLQMQYRKENNQFYLGLTHDQTRNEVRSRTLGRDTETGIGEWLHDWSPYISFRWNWESGHSLSAYYQGSTSQPSAVRINPVLDISNPLEISTGNVYLRPSYTHDAYVTWNYNNKKNLSYFSAYLDGTMTQRGIVSASWFDAEGVRYSVPVNTQKPSYTLYGNFSWRQPVGKKKRLTLSGGLYGNLSSSTHYQATGRRAGMDLLAFNYNSFMADFWGDASGSRFYGGQSGFSESRVLQYYLNGNLGFTYRLDRFSIDYYSYAVNERSSYSLDPSANTNYWRFGHRLELLYETLHGWEFKSYVEYNHYRGYAAGFNDPYCLWDISVSKNINAFTLTLGISDLLNQDRLQQHTVNAEYIEDRYSLIMGRYAMFSVKWNFGKMNPAKNARVQNAMYNMM